MINVSVITWLTKNRQCLNKRAVSTPKATPIATETTKSTIRSTMIVNITSKLKSLPYRLNTTLNIEIEKIAFVIPSPKRHEWRLG
jgi:hypothetical protein